MYRYSPGRIPNHVAEADNIVVTNATVIDGTGADPFVADVTVLGGRIVNLGPRTEPDDGAKVIEGAGMFLTPGLIDCHVHLTGLEGRDPFRRNIDKYPSVRLLRATRDAIRILQAGFTTVRHLGHGVADQAQALKEAIADGLVAGPRMQTCGWAMSQTGGHGNLHDWPYQLVEDLRPRSAFVDGPDDCRKFVRRQLGDGAEWIKVYTSEGLISSPDHLIDIPNYSMAELEAIVDEAHRRGARVAAHSTGLEGSLNAVKAGVDTLEHGPHAPDDTLIDLMAQNGTTLVPTLDVFEYAAFKGESYGWPDWVSERARRWLPGRREMVAAAAEAGITIAVGSDSGQPPRGGKGAAEIGALVRAGLSPLQALSAATKGGAKALGIDDLGVVALGARADLVLWRINPLESPDSLSEDGVVERVIQAEVQ
ncbi:MAG TPA: amidohydrolase family protein [Acidimicrobiia bacterium]